MTFRTPGKRIRVEPVPKEAPMQPEPAREPAAPEREKEPAKAVLAGRSLD